MSNNECAFCNQSSKKISEQIREDDEARYNTKICKIHGEIGIRMKSGDIKITNRKQVNETDSYVAKPIHRKPKIRIHIPLRLLSVPFSLCEQSLLQSFFKEPQTLNKDIEFPEIKEYNGTCISKSVYGSYTILHYQKETKIPIWGTGALCASAIKGSDKMRAKGYPEFDNGVYEIYNSERDLNMGVNCKVMYMSNVQPTKRLVFSRIYLGWIQEVTKSMKVDIKLGFNRVVTIDTKITHVLHTSRITDTIVDRFINIDFGAELNTLGAIKDKLDEHCLTIMKTLIKNNPFLRRYLLYNKTVNILDSLGRNIGRHMGNPIDLGHISDIRHLLYRSSLMYYKTDVRLMWFMDTVFLFLSSKRYVFMIFKKSTFITFISKTYRPRIIFPMDNNIEEFKTESNGQNKLEDINPCVQFHSHEIILEGRSGQCYPEGEAVFPEYNSMLAEIDLDIDMKLAPVNEDRITKVEIPNISEDQKSNDTFKALVNLCESGGLWLCHTGTVYPIRINNNSNSNYRGIENIMTFMLSTISPGSWSINDCDIKLNYNWCGFVIDKDFKYPQGEPKYNWLNYQYEVICQEGRHQERALDLCEYMYGRSQNTSISCPKEMKGMFVERNIPFRHTFIRELNFKNSSEICNVMKEDIKVMAHKIYILYNSDKIMLYCKRAMLGRSSSLKDISVFGNVEYTTSQQLFCHNIVAELNNIRKLHRINKLNRNKEKKVS